MNSNFASLLGMGLMICLTVSPADFILPYLLPVTALVLVATARWRRLVPLLSFLAWSCLAIACNRWVGTYLPWASLAVGGLLGHLPGWDFPPTMQAPPPSPVMAGRRRL